MNPSIDPLEVLPKVLDIIALDLPDLAVLRDLETSYTGMTEAAEIGKAIEATERLTALNGVFGLIPKNQATSAADIADPDATRDREAAMSAPTTLEELQARVSVWQAGGEPIEVWALAKAVKIGEEGGEAEGAILKYLEGRVAKGHIEDELGDLLIAMCGASALLDIDLMAVAARRFAGDVEHRATYPIGDFS